MEERADGGKFGDNSPFPSPSGSPATPGRRDRLKKLVTETMRRRGLKWSDLPHYFGDNFTINVERSGQDFNLYEWQETAERLDIKLIL